MSPASNDHTPGNDGIVADEVLVSVTPGADRDDVEALYADLGATVRERLDSLSVDRLGIDPKQRDEVCTALDDSPLTDGVDDNEVIDLEIRPADPLYPHQWHLPAIEAPAAWERTTGSPAVLVAVLDTGVDINHVDLASKLRAGANTIDGSGWQDTVGHGTEVAGIIAAAADSQAGVASIAWQNPILPIRVVNEAGNATSWSLAAGIALAVEQGAKVINVSFAPTHDDIVLKQAELARLSGALVVFAVGNEGVEIAGGGSRSALFVGATDQDGSLAGFSSYGQLVDLVAPGVSIYTTQIGDTYGSATGSSFAAPVVSGVAALVWSVNPQLRPATVEGILLSTADDLGAAGDDVRFGAGQVNARAAVELAAVIVEQRDATPPVVSIDAPADGATVSGQTRVEVTVQDDSDLADVTLRVDGAARASDTIAPYAFVIDTGDYAAGQHEISVVATDVFGNTSESAIALIFGGADDREPPKVTMVSPTPGAVVRGLVTIIADGRDNRLLTHADVLVDGSRVGTVEVGTSEAKLAYNWDAGKVKPGDHTITVRFVDTSGNVGEARVDVTVLP